MGRAGRGDRDREQRADAYAERADVALWRGRGESGGDQAGAGARDQDARSLHADRHARAALRRRDQIARAGGVRNRYPLARHGLCGDETIADLWREAERLLVRRDPQHAGRDRRGADGEHRIGERRCRGCRQLVARQGRAGQAAGRVGAGSERRPGHVRSDRSLSREGQSDGTGRPIDEGDADAVFRRASEDRRSRICAAAPGARADGAAQLHGAGDRPIAPNCGSARRRPMPRC